MWYGQRKLETALLRILLLITVYVLWHPVGTTAYDNPVLHLWFGSFG